MAMAIFVISGNIMVINESFPNLNENVVYAEYRLAGHSLVGLLRNSVRSGNIFGKLDTTRVNGLPRLRSKILKPEEEIRLNLSNLTNVKGAPSQ
jgi:hypothetical protein